MVSVRGPVEQQEVCWYLKQKEFNMGDRLHSDFKAEKLRKMLRQHRG